MYPCPSAKNKHTVRKAGCTADSDLLVGRPNDNDSEEERVSCEKRGKVDLLDPPVELQALFTGSASNVSNCREFRAHIRQYNSALAFASFTANEEDVKTNRRGLWIWKSGYTLYHSRHCWISSNG